jgi:prefoldin subunit 5
VADNNIDLTASFDASNAIKGVNDFGKAANSAVDGVNESFNGLQKSIAKTSQTKLNIDASSAISSLDNLKGKIVAVGAGIAAYFSAQMVTGFFGKMIDEAVDAENNLNQLNAALARSGQLTTETSASMQKFATDLMAVSTIDDDVINGQLAIAMNFTKSSTKAQELVRAAADLSSAMKIDLGTAVELLGRSLDGTAGRLNETVPALRGVSEEALKSGAAIEIVGRAFSGAATAEISTYSGAMAQLSNVYGNFAASLGNMIVQNPMVAQSIKEISNAFMGATASIEAGTSSSIGFVNRGISAMISGIRDLIPSLNSVSSFMKSIAFLFEAMLKGVMSFVDGLKILGNSWLWLVGTMSGKQTALDDINAAIDRMKTRGDDLAESLKNIGKDSFTKMDLKDFDDALKRIQEAANKKPIEIKATVNAGDIPNVLKGIELKPPKIEAPKIDKIEAPKIDTPKSTAEKESEFFPFKTQEELDKAKFLDQFILAGGAISGTRQKRELPKKGDDPKEEDKPSKFLPDTLIPGMFDGFTAVTIAIGEGLWNVKQFFSKNLPSIITSMSSNVQSLVAAMGQGAEGAKKAVPDIIANMVQGAGSAVGAIWGPIGSAIGSGIGGIIGEQIKLASGPIGETMQKIDEFMTELPNVLDRITQNLPTIMNKVFENLPNILMVILKALPEIMRASASAMKPLFKEIGKDSVPMIKVLVDIVWESIAMIGMAIGYAIQGIALGLGDYFREKFDAALNKFGGFMDEITNAWNVNKDAALDAIDSISMERFVKGIEVGLEKLGSNITDIFDRIVSGIRNFFDQIFDLPVVRDLVSVIQDGFKSIFSGDTIASLGNSIKSGFSSLFSTEFYKNIWDAVTKGFSDIFSTDFFKDIWDTVTNGFSDLFSADFYKSLGQSIIDGFKDLLAKLDPTGIVGSIGGGGGGGGLLGGSIIPGVLATGGVVPKGYPDDKYPAMLTSNEVVVPAQTTPNLFALIDKLAKKDTGAETSVSNEETNELLKQLIAIIANQQTYIDVKLDKDTLAKAIVSLNKDNRRLA